MTDTPSETLSLRAYRLAALALPLILVVVHWDWLVLGHFPFGGDAPVFFPLLEEYRRWVEGGHLPLWSESIFCGQPVVMQSEPTLLHPVRWALLKWTGIHAEGLWLYLLSVIPGFGMLLYLRRIGCSRLAGLVGAYAAGFGGYMTVQATHSHVLAGAALIPVMLYLVERIFTARRPALWVSLLALVTALQWLSGHGQVPMLSAYYLGLYTALRAWIFYRESEGRVFAPVPWVAAGLVAGLLLVAFQILPLMEILGQTPRAEGLSYRDSAHGSLPPWGLLLPLFPALYGPEALSEDTKFWLSSAGGQVGAWEFHFYAGAAVGLLALAGLWRTKGHAHGRTHLVLFLFCLLFILGKFTPLYKLAWYLPGIHQSRVPARATVLVFFSMITLAAQALDHLTANRPQAIAAWKRLGRRTLLAIVGLWIILAIGIRVAEAPLMDTFERAAHKAELKRFETHDITDAESRAERLAHAELRAAEVMGQLKATLNPLSVLGLTNLGFLALSVLVVSALIAAPSSRERQRWALALLAVLAVDLLWFEARFGVHNPGDDPRKPPAYASRIDRSERVFSLIERRDEPYLNWRVMNAYLTSNLAAAWDLDIPHGDTSTGPGEFMALHEDLRLGYLAGIERLRRTERLEPRLAVMGVGYVIAQTPWGELPWERVYRDDLVSVWKLADPMPRWFLSARQDLTDVTLWKAALADEVPTARTTALLQGLRTSLVGSVRALPTPTPDTARFEIDAPVPATFVRTTRNFPGWRAFVDGEEIPVKTVVGFFQGVDVPAGRHELRFVFDPPALRNGIRISAAAAVVIAGFLGWGLFGPLRGNYAGVQSEQLVLGGPAARASPSRRPGG